MDCQNIDDIAKLIARRDDCSIEEAKFLINECKEEIDYVLSHSVSGTCYFEVEDILASMLQLEPDYLMLFLE